MADGESEALQVCGVKCYGASSTVGVPGATGAPFAGPGAGQLRGPEGIVVDNSASLSHGDVYVIDAGNHRVQKFTREGEFILMFGREVNSNKSNLCLASEAQKCKAGGIGSGPGQFKGLGGRAIAVDESGVVYVGDENRVQRFSEAGALLGEIKLPGVGLIENLAVDSTDDIYVTASALKGVHKYNASGSELGTPRDIGGEGGPLEAPHFALAIAPGDELFLNDFRPPNHRILGFDAAGNVRASFDPGGLAEDGRLGIAYSPTTEALYILNQTAVRIVTPPAPGLPYILPAGEQAGEVKPSSAKLEAKINPEGPEASVYRFEYGLKKGKYEHTSAETTLKGGEFEDQDASATITGLTPGTTYHFRVIAENAAHEVSEGRDQSFTTPPPVLIEETSAAEVNATSARLEAQLEDYGRASEYRFQYGTGAYEKETPEQSLPGAGSTQSVKNLIQELLPDTTYHYRVIARNALNGPGEYVLGPDRTLTTQGEGSTLPDGRFWEQISPPNKHGAPLEPLTEEGGLIQAAARGGAITYVALGPVTGEAAGVRSPEDSQVLSRRDPSGWATQDITTRHEEISLVAVGRPAEYKLFSEDLSAGIVEPVGATRLAPEDPANTERTPYRREADGSFVPLVNANNVLAGAHFGGTESPPESGQWEGVEFITATPDLSHVLIESPAVLTAGFKAGFEGGKSIYELADGALTLVSILPSGEPAAEAGLKVGVGHNDLDTRGAISSDGGRVIFEAEIGETHAPVPARHGARRNAAARRAPGAGRGAAREKRCSRRRAKKAAGCSSPTPRG